MSQHTDIRRVQSVIGAIFVPVRDIEQARDWYARLLGLTSPPGISLGHLAVFPLDGSSTDLVLDSRIHRPEEKRTTPLFLFAAPDIHQAREHVVALGAAKVGEIQYEEWFTFADPDDNILMIRHNDQ